MFKLIFFLLTLSLPLVAQDESETKEILAKSCSDPASITYEKEVSGKVSPYIIIQDGQKKVMFNCSGINPHHEMKEEPECELTAEKKLNQLTGEMSLVTGHAACGDEQGNEGKVDNCFHDAGCMLYNDTLPGMLSNSLGGNEGSHATKVKSAVDLIRPKSCQGVTGADSGCMADIAKGFITGIAELVKSVGYLGGVSAEWAKEKLRGFFGDHKFLAVDNEQAEALHALRQMPATLLEEFKNDFFGTSAKLVKSMIADTANLIKKASSCQKWKGTPLVSDCAEEMPTWGCMNCAEKLGLMCSSVGLISAKAGEIVLAYFTGGVLGATKIASALGGVASNISKSAKFLSKSAISTGRFSAATGAIKSGGKALSLSLDKIKKTPGLKQYIELENKAFAKGMEAGSGVTGGKSVITKVDNAGDLSETNIEGSRKAKKKFYTENRDLDWASNLSPEERVGSASELLGKKLSPDQEKAILAAHNVGSEKGYFQYSESDLRQKIKILDSAGFDRDQREVLMRLGITGNNVEKMAPSKIKAEDIVSKMSGEKQRVAASAIDEFRALPEAKRMTTQQRAEIEYHLAHHAGAAGEFNTPNSWRITGQTLGRNGADVKTVQPYFKKAAESLDLEIEKKIKNKSFISDDDRFRYASIYIQAGKTDKAAEILSKSKTSIDDYSSELQSGLGDRAKPFDYYVKRKELETFQILVDKNLISNSSLKNLIREKLDYLDKKNLGKP